MRVDKRAAALIDLDGHAQTLQRQSAALALRFLDAAEETIRKLAAQPRVAGRWETDDLALQDIQVWPVRGFKNHLIFFRVHKDRLEIVRVLHGAQDIESEFRNP